MAPRNGFAALAERARELQRSRHTFDFKQAQKREFRTVPRPRERPVGPGSDAEWCAYRRTSQRTNNGPDRRNDRATLLIQNRRTKLQMFTITATTIPDVPPGYCAGHGTYLLPVALDMMTHCCYLMLPDNAADLVTVCLPLKIISPLTLIVMHAYFDMVRILGLLHSCPLARTAAHCFPTHVQHA